MVRWGPGQQGSALITSLGCAQGCTEPGQIRGMSRSRVDRGTVYRGPGVLLAGSRAPPGLLAAELPRVRQVRASGEGKQIPGPPAGAGFVLTG